MAKRKSKKKLFIVLGVLAVIIVAITAFIFSKGKDKPIEVSTARVERRTITQTVSAVGKIEAETEVKVSSETSGEIEMLSVKEGDTVRRGSLLAKIRPDIVETMLEQSKAAADAMKTEIEIRKAERDHAKIELQRTTELMNKDYASKQDFEKVKTGYETAEAAYRSSLSRYSQSMASLKQVQREASRTTIFAPIDGIVTKLDVEMGEKVVGTAQMQGTEMMRVSDLSVMNAEVEVDENDIVLVNVGDTARIEVDALPDKVYNGVVIEIGHSALVNQLGTQDQVTNFKVKVRIIDKESRLRPGMSCNVDVETETKQNVLSVPLQSVTIRDLKIDAGGQGADDKGGDEGGIERVKDDTKKQKTDRPPSVVFVKKGQTAKMVKVKTGISDNGFIEITEGISEGQEVISGSYMAISKELKDGSLIKIDSAGRKKQSGKKTAEL